MLEAKETKLLFDFIDCFDIVVIVFLKYPISKFNHETDKWMTWNTFGLPLIKVHNTLRTISQR